MIYLFSLILLLAAGPALAQAVSDPTREALPRELMAPQPLEQTPALRAPGPADELITPPEPPASDRSSEPRADQPDDGALSERAVVREADHAPLPPPRPSSRQRADAQRAPQARATVNRPASPRAARRSAPQRVAAGRPLSILPPAAGRSGGTTEVSESARAFAPVADAPAPPWPFRLGPMQPQFDVPAGWW